MSANLERHTIERSSGRINQREPMVTTDRLPKTGFTSSASLDAIEYPSRDIPSTPGSENHALLLARNIWIERDYRPIRGRGYARGETIERGAGFFGFRSTDKPFGPRRFG